MRTSLLKVGQLRAWWFNPRDGSSRKLGEFSPGGELAFDPPESGEQNDWVLVLDHVEANYPPPGKPQ